MKKLFLASILAGSLLAQESKTDVTKEQLALRDAQWRYTSLMSQVIQLQAQMKDLEGAIGKAMGDLNTKLACKAGHVDPVTMACPKPETSQPSK